jgi:hypothetical protein
MSSGTQKKIVRLLGVGFDADDGHVRITTGERYDVLMGSDESHEYMLQLISKIEEEISRRGLDLDGLSPETLGEIVRDLR